MRLTKAQKRLLLTRHGRWVEETGAWDDPNAVWYWPMRIRRGVVTHARWPKRSANAAWQVLARQHLMH